MNENNKTIPFDIFSNSNTYRVEPRDTSNLNYEYFNKLAKFFISILWHFYYLHILNNVMLSA